VLLVGIRNLFSQYDHPEAFCIATSAPTVIYHYS
jgi:hypothetical protein